MIIIWRRIVDLQVDHHVPEAERLAQERRTRWHVPLTYNGAMRKLSRDRSVLALSSPTDRVLKAQYFIEPWDKFMQLGEPMLVLEVIFRLTPEGELIGTRPHEPLFGVN